MSAAAVEVHGSEEIGGTPVLLRQQAAEALAAHRSRRQRVGVDRGVVAESTEAAVSRLSRSQLIASRVTERYAQTQSYRAFLAAEAEEATRRAKAKAEIAARSAEAVAAAQRELMEEFAAAEEAQERESEVVRSIRREQAVVREEEEICSEQSAVVARGGLTVRLFEDVRHTMASRSLDAAAREAAVRGTERHCEDPDSEETRALDEEISFRQSPTFDLEGSSVSIPGNLLEFPRQLVAARKARPSYALGPLGEDGREAHGGAQLRIFEVDAAEITSATPAESSAAEWSSIWLDALAKDSPEEASNEVQKEATRPVLEAASLERRIMASVVDACLIGMGFVAFAATFAYNAAVLPSVATAGIYGAGVLAGMMLLYQMLFFTLSEATPGMRYVRIGLCTFDDENPGRGALLRRVFATLLAGCPMGLGLLWACLDEDRLGWHDRMSGMYQRSY